MVRHLHRRNWNRDGVVRKDFVRPRLLPLIFAEGHQCGGAPNRVMAERTTSRADARPFRRGPADLLVCEWRRPMEHHTRDEARPPLNSASGMYRRMIWPLVLAGILYALGCGKPSDQEAYEEVVATMSMERAKHFFSSYPQSPYRNRLADQIAEWCKREDTRECYRLILDVLPKDLARYQEVAAYYEKRFGNEAK